MRKLIVGLMVALMVVSMASVVRAENGSIWPFGGMTMTARGGR